jgi:hypothetical protein
VLHTQNHGAQQLRFGDHPDLLIGDLGASPGQVHVGVDQSGHDVVAVEVDFLDVGVATALPPRYCDIGTTSAIHRSRTTTAWRGTAGPACPLTTVTSSSAKPPPTFGIFVSFR